MKGTTLLPALSPQPPKILPFLRPSTRWVPQDTWGCEVPAPWSNNKWAASAVPALMAESCLRNPGRFGDSGKATQQKIGTQQDRNQFFLNVVSDVISKNSLKSGVFRKISLISKADTRQTIRFKFKRRSELPKTWTVWNLYESDMIKREREEGVFACIGRKQTWFADLQ